MSSMLLAVVVLLCAGCNEPRQVATAQAACAVATERVTSERRLPISHVAMCDNIAEADSPDGYYVLAMLAYCKEDVCGSTSMGWFAVEKSTGEVFEIADVTDWRIGRRIGPGA